MSYYRFLGHADTFAVIAQLAKVKNDFDADGLLVLRDAAGKETPAYASWKSLHRLLNKLRAVARLTEEFGEIFIERMAPGTATEWAAEVDPKYLSFLVPLVTNPLVYEYFRQETLGAPMVGSLWWTETAVHRSSANWGETPRYHLIVQIRKAPPPDAD